MLTPIIQIGNSRGIRLPKSILRQLNIKDEVEMITHKNTLIIKNENKKPRESWNEAFAKMPKNKADSLLLDENIDSEDFEWVW